jgi:hypothetical protein
VSVGGGGTWTRPRNYLGKIKLSAFKAAGALRALFSDMRDARFASTCI